MANLDKLALYFHIPFCVSRCRYCDFYSETGIGRDLIDKTLDALLISLDFSLEKLQPGRISTVFIGGGTPSLAPPDLFGLFLSRLKRRIGSVDEFSVEVNPESLSADFLDSLQANGADRISMGVQTYDPHLLSWLGRPAGAEALERADSLLESRWKGRLSRDILASLPGEPDRLLNDLKKAIRDDPGHLSVYELTVEPGTPLAESDADLRTLPDEEVNAGEWESAISYLAERGYHRYEVSNFSRAGEESRHNLTYWRMMPYLGIGPGAVSTIPGKQSKVLRREEPKDLVSWLSAPTDSFSETAVSTDELALEYFMMGLRISEGISVERFKSVFGITPAESAPRAIRRWTETGAIVPDENWIRPSPSGMDIIDRILGDIALELEMMKWPDFRGWPPP